MFKIVTSLFGFEGYVSNPRSGRPEEPISWHRERFMIWAAWAMALVGIFGEAYSYSKLGRFDGTFGSVGLTFAAIAFLRSRTLARRKRELSAAIKSYEGSFRRHASF
jgi:hypothetical protein